ncbi:unnamed protein product [Rotaria magnacalcarata]|uniref:BTB domain-containing protein n=3 Tax=Rotaria magnacalcarata TaxID=392030 RepID=A0A816W1Z6_9BILA|nr:unnamed protein product [Rotaria magnacalcarata]CAF1619883.1 unnamed protein product [Rotaria magnacalcarata]CAF2127987.1 unnamed protein product [Rotaria magnacalcarata]CAF4306739.1 unnamed protein product [Rotaria magnacalcarata]CAF4358885.1 unnamed protein product [Rotaria magnacalcarata]
MPSPPPPVPAPRSLSVSSLIFKCTDDEKKNFKDDIVTFNVGGHIYSTTCLTINDIVDSQSLLSLIISNRTTTPLDKNGHYFIDRDGTYFRYILNYFRDKKLLLPENFTELKQLCSEAKYYQIDRLVNEIENRLNTTNEHNKQLEIGVNFTLISSLNQGGKILTLIGPLKLISLFHIEPIGKKFLKIISSYADPNNISCQCTFPVDDKLISCQPFDQLQRIVLAKQARKMGLAVSYCDDYFYIPIERQVMLRDELAQLLLNGCHGKLLHTNVTYEKKSNSDHDGSYSLVENWFVPNISIAKCLEANGSISNNGNIYSSTSMINGF